MRQLEVSDRGLIRVLPTTHIKPPAQRGLVDTEDELNTRAQIEGLTRGRGNWGLPDGSRAVPVIPNCWPISSRSSMTFPMTPANWH